MFTCLKRLNLFYANNALMMLFIIFQNHAQRYVNIKGVILMRPPIEALKLKYGAIKKANSQDWFYSHYSPGKIYEEAVKNILQLVEYILELEKERL